MRGRAVQLLCLLTLGIATLRAAEPTLVVGVCNIAHIPEKVLNPALVEARRIFDEAGVATEWIDRYALPGASVMLNMRVLPGESRNRQAPDAFGSAWLTRPAELSNLADVSYGRVEEKAWPYPNTANLLAHVMAHEVGHLLLGAKHSDTGIMSGQWSAVECTLAQFWRLKFSKAEAARLRAAAKERVKAAGASGR